MLQPFLTYVLLTFLSLVLADSTKGGQSSLCISSRLEQTRRECDCVRAHIVKRSDTIGQILSHTLRYHLMWTRFCKVPGLSPSQFPASKQSKPIYKQLSTKLTRSHSLALPHSFQLFELKQSQAIRHQAGERQLPEAPSPPQVTLRQHYQSVERKRPARKHLAAHRARTTPLPRGSPRCKQACP